MPSSSRRHFLTAASTAGLVASTGCIGFGSSRPDVNPATGLAQDTSQALNDEEVYLAGDRSDLPTPPLTAETVEDADVILATAIADSTILTRAIQSGKPVAVAGDGATATMHGLLDSVGEEYSFGVETVRARPVSIVVAIPRGDTVATFTFVAEGGWEDSVLDPLGWALVGRVPDCATFAPESSMDDAFAYAGATHVVGRLPTGETYAARSVASASRQDAELFVRLRTKLHAASNEGYAIESAVRETDLPDDQHLHHVYPNPHTQNGVQVANVSDTTRSTFAIEVTPERPRTRRALTGCGGFRTAEKLAYDYRTSFRWKRDRLLNTNRHYATATGRGEWHFTG